MDWENHLEKKSDPKNRKKNIKSQREISPYEKIPLARKRIFVQTPISHSTLKLQQKISCRKIIRFFAPFSL